jgi:dTDP-4-dehydrorhamnose reductase
MRSLYLALWRRQEDAFMRLLITGASGQLGAYLLRSLRDTSDVVEAWSRSPAQMRFGFQLQPVDLSNERQVAEAFARARPNVVIHAAAVASIAACHSDPASAWTINREASARLATLAGAAGVRLVLVSTDLVFDGTRGWYTETDEPSPLSVYGMTKHAAEQAVLANAGAVVARLGLLYGPTLIGRPAFFDEQVTALQTGTPIRCFVDEWRTPLALEMAAHALLALARSDAQGIFHLGGPQRLSRWEMAFRLAGTLGLDQGPIVPVMRADVPAPEQRPRDTSLACSRWRAGFPAQSWPTFETALREMMEV